MKKRAILISLIAIFTILQGVSAYGDNYTSGTEAGRDLNGGDWNAFVGDYAGLTETTGDYNVAIGQSAGKCINPGYRNVFIGFKAGFGVCTVSSVTDSVAVGYEAGLGLTSGDFNVFVGSQAGQATTTGYINTFVGNAAGFGNVDGYRNVYIGNSAGALNVSGDHNIFIGDHAGHDETGLYRLYIAPTGTATPLIYGEFDDNKLVVNGSLTVTGTILTSSGTGDTFFGEHAGDSNSSGAYNTFVGTYAGGLNSSGTNNTYIGQAAGYQSNGSGNVFIGNGAGYYETGSNKLYISNSVTAFPLIYGDFSSGIVKIYGSLTMLSDERLKKNIEPLHSPLATIERLRGVSYEWNDMPHEGRGFGGNKEIGLIAQEVEKTLPEVVHTDGEGLKSVSYDNLTALLIEAVKEQGRKIVEQNKLLDDKSRRIEMLKRALARIEEKVAGLPSPLISAALP